VYLADSSRSKKKAPAHESTWFYHWLGSVTHEGRHQYGHSGVFSGIRAFCECTWDNVQYSVVAAGDQDQQFNQIVEQVVQLGR